MNGLMEALGDNKDLTWIMYEWTNEALGNNKDLTWIMYEWTNGSIRE